MSALLVTYDLKQPGQDYKPLHDAIKNLGSTWWHYLESTWLVATTRTADAASAALLPHIDKNDRLLVLNITGDAYQGWLPAEAWEWIRKHV
jgi:hypothetical protein